MTYLHWLLVLCLSFLALERLSPARPAQPLNRRGLGRDLGFLALNGHLFGFLTAGAEAWIAVQAVGLLQRTGARLEGSPVPEWPAPLQVLVLLVFADFLQWCVHRTLHHVPWLWQFHKVHHSISEMDWLGNWHFHWMEILVYRAAQWIPLAWLGASPQAALVVAVVGTLWGNLNHANLDWDHGPLGRIFNSPRMHLWHHDASTEGGVAKNFGIVLSLWDFLFGTAFWPRDRSPQRIGYPGDAEMPATLLGQLCWPLTRTRSRPSPTR